jgi:hypothetical protein
MTKKTLNRAVRLQLTNWYIGYRKWCREVLAYASAHPDILAHQVIDQDGQLVDQTHLEANESYDLLGEDLQLLERRVPLDLVAKRIELMPGIDSFALYDVAQVATCALVEELKEVLHGMAPAERRRFDRRVRFLRPLPRVEELFFGTSAELQGSSS